MAYMHCPSCGLTIRLRASYLTLDCCPRCLARRRTIVAMRICARCFSPTSIDPVPSAESGSTSETDEPGRPACDPEDRPLRTERAADDVESADVRHNGSRREHPTPRAELPLTAGLG
jgi:hypothetical protein